MASPLEAVAWPFIAAPADAPRQAIALTWTGDGPPARALVAGAQHALEWSPVGGEKHRAVVLVRLSEQPATPHISAGGHEVACVVQPPRRWQLFLVNHSHVDIGYTEFQDLLHDAHGDYIAQALDLMRESDGRSEAEQYRWTCESSWTVEQFLRRHPQREQEFVQRIREGRMELTALYVNLTDLCSQRLLEESVRYACSLRHRWGIELVSACNYDVNGWGWDLPRILKQADVRYFDTAINETRARGVQPKPRPFRWASPDGSDVLMWHSLGYGMGNSVLLHTTAGRAEAPLASLLNRLAAEGYPHTGLEMLMHGMSGDSMPPDGAVCDVVGEWNRKWRWPRLRLATVRQWFGHLDQHWPEKIAVHQKAWPDWWADGNGSALFEAALVRRAQARLEDLEAQRESLAREGIDLARLDEQYREGWRRALVFCEHTFGPYETALDPDSPASRGQWHHKAANAYAADACADSIQVEQIVAAATAGKVSARQAGMTNATLQGEPSGYLAGGDPPAVLVFNPLDHERSDVVRAWCPGYFTGGKPPALRDGVTGRPVPMEIIPNDPHDVVNLKHCQIEFLAVDLPPRAHRIYWIEPGNRDDCRVGTAHQPAGGGQCPPYKTMENRHFRLTIDPLTGGVRSLIHKPTGREIVQQNASYSLNQCTHEQVASPEGRNAIASWGGLGKEAAFRRTTPAVVAIETVGSRLPLQRLSIRGEGENGLHLHTQITLFDDAEHIEIVNTLDTAPSADAQAIYHAFPLLSASGQIHLDVPGGVVRPGLDQVPGTATDWHSIQHWFAVSDDDYAVVVASPDVPLVQCTGINTGRWMETMPAANGLVMSWAMNNYWFTNFPVRQGGRVTYRYSIMPQAGAFDARRASRFACEVRHRAFGKPVRIAKQMRSA